MATAHPRLAELTEDERAILRPLVETGRTFYLAAGILAAITLWGMTAYVLQVRYGLGLTGLNQPSYWGIYIINFVFFIGVSHAGTLISAILRISKAEWRRSITRSAEFITVLVLGYGAIQPIIDLGRPDRMLNIFINAHGRSPLVWDVTSIALYLTASTVYLYLPMLPDLALIRDHRIKCPRFYRFLAAGYRDTPEQRHRLERIIGVLAIVVIPIAVSVHTVIGWIFALTLRPMWHSTIFGPYFVMGAIYSGIAAVLLAMAVLRRVYRLENYFRDIHFDYMGRLLLLFSVLWFYFTFAEYLTAIYGNEPAEMRTFWAKLTGPFAIPFWTMVASCFIIPLALMCRRRTRTARGTSIASVFVLLGMWLERFNIVVPTSVNPRMELESVGSYFPSWVELSIMAATFSGFILVYMVATKFFPFVSIWEIKEGRDVGVEEVAERVRSYLPERGHAAPAAPHPAPPGKGRGPAALGGFSAFLLILFAATTAAPARAQDASEILGNPVNGRVLFLGKGCVRCHAIWGNGGTVGPDVAAVGSHHSMLELAGLFWNHTPQMIENARRIAFDWPTLEESELADIISYFYYIKLFDEPGDPVSGERSFREKRCAECHRLGGNGGQAGPALDGYARYVAPIMLASGMWNHGGRMQAAHQAQGIAPPSFLGHEIADIQAYIRQESSYRNRRLELLSLPDPRRGARLFESKGCAQCHGAGGRGSTFAPDLRVAVVGLSVSDITGDLISHSLQMLGAMRTRGVPFPTFTGDEMADVIAYVYFLRFYDAPGSAVLGEQVFLRKGCTACHTLDGQSAIGPELRTAVGTTPLSLVAAMWNHAPGMFDKTQSENATWPRFDRGEMRHLYAYLRQLVGTSR